MRREGHQFADNRRPDRSAKPQELTIEFVLLAAELDAPATLPEDLLSSLDSDHARSSSRFSFTHNQIASATRVFHQRKSVFAKRRQHRALIAFEGISHDAPVFVGLG